jgi:pilus assembly protein CpaB
MKTRRLILLASALLLAVATAWVARALLRPPAPVTIVKEVAVMQPQPRQVLVAQRDLQPGIFLDGSALSWQALPAEALRAQHLEADSPAQQRRLELELHGATLRKPVAAGQPLTRELLVYAGQPGFVAAVLAPGMRAVSIPTNVVSSNAGLVSAGDRVDVILSLERDSLPVSNTSSETPFSQLAAQTIVHDVRVLALNSNTESITPTVNSDKPEVSHSKPSSNSPRFRSVTLEVTPAAAEKLALAREVGSLQLTLRGVNEAPVTSPTASDSAAAVTRLADTTRIFERQDQRPSNATVRTFLGNEQGQQVFGSNP